MSNQLQLLVGNNDLTRYLEDGTWYIDQEWGHQATTATFYLIDEHDYGSFNYVVRPLDRILLFDAGLGQPLFGGLVTTPKLYHEGTNLSRWWLNCTDWTYLADKTVVQGDFLNQPVDAIVRSITSGSTSGIHPSDIHSGPFLPFVRIPYGTLSQAWTRLTQLASSGGTSYGWWVDETATLHWYANTQVAWSGITITDDENDLGNPNTILVSADSSYFFYDWEGSSIYNRVTVRGATYTRTQTDQFVGNSAQSSFPLTFTVNAANLNAKLLVNGVNTPVTADTGGNPTSAYILTESVSGQWFLRTGTVPPPAAGVLLVLTYDYQAPVIAQVNDLASQQSFSSLPNHGIFTEYIPDSSIASLATARQRAAREITEFSVPQEQIQVKIPEYVNADPENGLHLRVGTIIRIKSRAFPDSESNYTKPLDGYFFITRNRMTGVPGKLRTYSIMGVRVNGFAAISGTSLYGTAGYGAGVYS